MAEEMIAWFAGVDWGSEKHQVCLLSAQGAIIGEREFPHSGKGLSELADWILSGVKRHVDLRDKATRRFTNPVRYCD